MRNHLPKSKWNFPRVEIALNSFLRELSRYCKKVTKLLTSNSKVSSPIESALSVIKAKVFLLTLKNPNLCCTFSCSNIVAMHCVTVSIALK